LKIQRFLSTSGGHWTAKSLIQQIHFFVMDASPGDPDEVVRAVSAPRNIVFIAGT
jgi:hypothetical protein